MRRCLHMFKGPFSYDAAHMMWVQAVCRREIARKWAFEHMQTAKLQASLRIRAVSPEALLFALSFINVVTANSKAFGEAARLHRLIRVI